MANLKRDGILTSLPLVRPLRDGFEVISGNHRVQAAVAAGIIESDVIVVTSELSREQFLGLQLSHNAIVGQDDPSILKSLYEELALEWREYSGLTDDAFKVEDLDTSVLRVDQVFYEELKIAFLPADAAVFTLWLDRMGKKAETALVGLYADFGLIFDTLVAVKNKAGIKNTAAALKLMAEMAGRALEFEEAAAKAGAAVLAASGRDVAAEIGKGKSNGKKTARAKTTHAAA